MEGLTRTIRLLIGLAMIAAGGVLATPAGLELAAWWQAHGAAEHAPGPLPPPAERLGPASGPQGLAAAPLPSAPALSTAGGPRRDYVPPPPPSPLPPVAAATAGAGPTLQGVYRSTLDVPPPPLLDSQRPPPLAVGWTPRGTAAARQTRQPERAAGPAVASRWRVRDGDDLTSIANSVYGTPQAAAAIWQANRGWLPDPRILPIGGEIVLPPAAAVWPDRGPQASIEPAVSGLPPPRPAGGSPDQAWLSPPPAAGG